MNESEIGGQLEPQQGKCGARSRSGRLCGRPAGAGTDHPGIGRCKLHGGSTPTHVAAAKRELVKREAEALGLSLEIDPATAILELVWRCAGDLQFYSNLVAREELLQVETTVGGGSKVSPHPWTVLYHQAEDRLSQVSQAALRAGVEERKVRLAERDARTFFAAVQATLVRLGFDDQTMKEFQSIFAVELGKSQQSQSIEASLTA